MKFKKYIKKLDIASEKYMQERAEKSASAFSLALISYTLTMSEEMNLNKYLEHLGLKEIEAPKSKEQTEKEAQSNIEKSKNIIKNVNFGGD